MTTVYKLTDSRAQTRGGMQWGVGVEHTALGGGALCSGAWIHAYSTPEQAVFMAPEYGYNTLDSLLWESEADVGIDDGTKLGCTRVRTLRPIPKPEVTTTQRVALAILYAAQVPQSIEWLLWAEGWMSGRDRSAASAEAEAASSAEVLAWESEAAAAAARALAWWSCRYRSSAAAEAATSAAEAATSAAEAREILPPFAVLWALVQEAL